MFFLSLLDQTSTLDYVGFCSSTMQFSPTATGGCHITHPQQGASPGCHKPMAGDGSWHICTTLIAPPEKPTSNPKFNILGDFETVFARILGTHEVWVFLARPKMYALRPKTYVENREKTILRTFEIVRNREHCLVRAWPFDKVIDQIALWFFLPYNIRP